METPTKERFAAALAPHDLRGHRHARRPARRAGGVDLPRASASRPTQKLGSGHREPEVQLRRVTAQADRRHRRDDREAARAAAGSRARARAPGRARLDEFQEVVKLDRAFPNLMRSVFQTQPEVGHVYLGSTSTLSTRSSTTGTSPSGEAPRGSSSGGSPREEFAPFVRRRFEQTDKGITRQGPRPGSLDATVGHPYGTQQLAYMTWELVPEGTMGREEDVVAALEKVLLGEHNHFAKIWDDATEHQRLLLLALAEEPSGLYGIEYQDAPRARVQHARAAGSDDAREGGDRRPERGRRLLRSSSRSSPTGCSRSRPTLVLARELRAARPPR